MKSQDKTVVNEGGISIESVEIGSPRHQTITPDALKGVQIDSVDANQSHEGLEKPIKTGFAFRLLMISIFASSFFIAALLSLSSYLDGLAKQSFLSQMELIDSQSKELELIDIWEESGSDSMSFLGVWTGGGKSYTSTWLDNSNNHHWMVAHEIDYVGFTGIKVSSQLELCSEECLSKFNQKEYVSEVEYGKLIYESPSYHWLRIEDFERNDIDIE